MPLLIPLRDFAGTAAYNRPPDEVCVTVIPWVSSREVAVLRRA
jgi:hypothetical protein